jgi:hypothetical protein
VQTWVGVDCTTTTTIKPFSPKLVGVDCNLFYFYFYKLRLPGFELETFGSDTMLDYDVPTSSPKSLS